MTTAEVLDKAADLIVERDWRQGIAVRSDGPVCASAAIFAAGATEEVTAEDAVDGLLYYLGIGMDGSIQVWNDAPSRTKDDVIAALRGAAAMERRLTGESGMTEATS